MVTKPATLVDVVVDVQTAQLDEPFTYSTGSFESPPVGSRVRVPFSGRIVSGWVVGNPQVGKGEVAVKPLEEVCDDPAVPALAIELARWIRRRYACTFREALAAVAPRQALHGERFQFIRAAQAGDENASLLERRLGSKRFSSLTADRVLRAAGRPVTLAVLRRKLRELAADGTLRRIESKQPGRREQSSASMLAVLEDAAAARGPAQRRLATALADAGSSLPIGEARRRSGTSAAVVRAAVAAGVLRLRPSVPKVVESAGFSPAVELTPTAEQAAAIDRLDTAFARAPAIALLQGITGSGKTYVYAQLIQRLRARGGQAAVLVPEIALTPQTAGRFQAMFGARVGVQHSGLSEAQRAKVWRDAGAGELDVVVGARSAVFAPLPRLRLVVIDEEHEPSYKQDVAPRYDAAVVAVRRMLVSGGSVLLGSATPSLETYLDALEGRILHVRLTQRATNAPLPPVEIVDMTRTRGLHGKRAIGPALTAAIETRLAAGEKTMLFVNRRGYAGVLLCRSCGFAPRCRRCSVSLVVHTTDRSMRCHVCGDAFRIPAKCPKCAASDLLPFGFGTQRVEEEARELFPGARIVRMDSDSTGAMGAHEKLLASFAAEGDILIGTQMIAKGLDFPTVTLVGVVAADLDLNRPDFRAAERTFSLLTQVAGRAGRAEAGSRVIVQAYAPQHYAITLAASHDYDAFATKELEIRRELRYPPFGRIAYVVVAGVERITVERKAVALAEHLRERTRDVEVLGPAPDVLPKARGEFRMRIALKSVSEDAMLDACGVAKAFRLGAVARCAIIVDPR